MIITYFRSVLGQEKTRCKIKFKSSGGYGNRQDGLMYKKMVFTMASILLNFKALLMSVHTSRCLVSAASWIRSYFSPELYQSSFSHLSSFALPHFFFRNCFSIYFSAEKGEVGKLKKKKNIKGYCMKKSVETITKGFNLAS